MSDADRTRLSAEALSLQDDEVRDKPDAKANVFADLGSPVSPLCARAASSSSSSRSGKSLPPSNAGGATGGRSDSGELVVESNPPRPTAHRRCGSGPLIFSGCGSSRTGGGGDHGSTASSPMLNALPAGNICPSGRVPGPASAPLPPRSRSDVLGSGTGHYGHGSIMRGTSRTPGRSSIDSPPPFTSRSPTSSLGSSIQEVTHSGNECYRKGRYGDALRHYDRAVVLCPDSASCRGNRAAALIGLGRLADALRECEEAIRLDQASGSAHGASPTSAFGAQYLLIDVDMRKATIFACFVCWPHRLGMIDKARWHFTKAEHLQHPDPTGWRKLQEVDMHVSKSTAARKIGDWKSAVREADAAVAAGADSAPLSIKSMIGFCRFDAAVAAAEKARDLDPGNAEIGMTLNNVKLVAGARAQGNKLFTAAKFSDASIAYGEGLKYDPFNSVLYCNRAACWSKLDRWSKAVDDCNAALRIRPNYTKALLRRAASYAKLERWVDCVRDYEVLRKELPGDKEVAEALFHAQVALKATRGEDVSNMKFGGEVEIVTNAEQLHAATGIFVVYFMSTMNQQCTQITPSVNALCTECPSVNFLKVNVDNSPMVAKAENVRIVPTFKIYKDGVKVKEMICPSLQVLRYSVRHYSVCSA
ncbi:hypothetical protein PR202_ga10502 [Eleusine coracana subsp. coracana]|uniref:Thioredoxin domain-containing protein n=1 Tax=Eleusine coracana subsp. coracana TaxID=191504 RepID=A0AAV5C6T7_ELECO|nr:hypothetical protein PR202_ga10502 [Eleusine coracana subsp. coracana]